MICYELGQSKFNFNDELAQRYPRELKNLEHGKVCSVHLVTVFLLHFNKSINCFLFSLEAKKARSSLQAE